MIYHFVQKGDKQNLQKNNDKFMENNVLQKIGIHFVQFLKNNILSVIKIYKVIEKKLCICYHLSSDIVANVGIFEVGLLFNMSKATALDAFASGLTFYNYFFRKKEKENG